MVSTWATAENWRVGQLGLPAGSVPAMETRRVRCFTQGWTCGGSCLYTGRGSRSYAFRSDSPQRSKRWWGAYLVPVSCVSYRI